jgi:hypothetical protein
MSEIDLPREIEATLLEVRASLKAIAREMKARGLRKDESIPADLEAPLRELYDRWEKLAVAAQGAEPA